MFNVALSLIFSSRRPRFRFGIETQFKIDIHLLNIIRTSQSSMVQSVQTLQREFSLAHYTWGPRIGTGGQGSVYEYSFNGNVYAAKVLYYTNEEETSNEDPSADVKRFREFCVMPRLSHVSRSLNLWS